MSDLTTAHLKQGLIDAIEDYIASRPTFFVDSLRLTSIKQQGNEYYLNIETRDKHCPKLFRVIESSKGDMQSIQPYFSIRRREIRQIMSFIIGKKLCNLSEISEFYGALYSRFSGSYEIRELNHVDGLLSKIALWVHDCLTEDFDHNTSLNRHNRNDGICISYDFDMAFSNYYFPPFYARELGLSDKSIEDNCTFVINQLEKYLQICSDKEDRTISQIKEWYPSTAKDDVCRYYLRNFKAYLPIRLYYGRFFQKLKTVPFDNEFAEFLGEMIKINVTGIFTWESLIEALSTITHPSLNLKHLDLSNEDLSRADLKGADLKDADLTGANLEGADLRGADLRGAKFSGADIENAKLEQVIC